MGSRFRLAMWLAALVVAFGAPVSTVAQNLEIGATPVAPPFEKSFTDVSDYWTIIWTEGWQVTEYEVVGDGELLQLSDSNWVVRLQGPVYDPLTDIGFVRGDARTALKDLAAAAEVGEPLFRPNGQPLQHFANGRSWKVFEKGENVIVFLDVRVLDDSGAFLYIIAYTEGGASVSNETYEQMLLLLENIQLLR